MVIFGGTPLVAKGAASASDDSDQHAKLEEIVVTAEKRTERLQDVPVPVTELSATTLVETNQVKLQDYYMEVPGLTIAPGVTSTQLLAIRGITTGGPFTTTSTVGILIDDLPYGGTQLLQVPDIDPGDLSSIEVLRGPQGTLYGASSMGGLLKFVTLNPSTDQLSGRVEAGTSSVYNGAEPGYNFRGSINVPLSDDLAIRASAFTRQDPGYIDNPFFGIRGINEDHAEGGHLSLLWRPLDAFSFKLSGLYQDTNGDGSNDVTTQSFTGAPMSGDLQQGYVRGVGGFDRIAQAYSATLVGQVGDVNLTSITGYNRNSTRDSFDGTYALGSLNILAYPNAPDATGAPSYNYNSSSKLSQELRVSTTFGHSIDFQFGGFYTHENNSNGQNFLAAYPTTGVVAGPTLYAFASDAYQEYAVFTDLTFHFTDQFDIQVGGRQSHIQLEDESTGNIGPFVPIIFPTTSNSYYGPVLNSSANPFTYLFTPQFKFSPDLMVYARLASGYRPGGANGPGPGVPPEFGPDKTYNYELGTKGDIREHLLSFDVSVYFIDWKNIQLGLVNPATQYSYTGNGGEAISKGAEVSLQLKPRSGLSIQGWLDFADAAIKSVPPNSITSSFYAAPGYNLPYSARFSGNLSANQEFPLTDKITGFVGGAVSYVGSRLDVLTGATPTGGATPRQDLPAYAKTDLRAGVKTGPWTMNAYVNNVADRRGLLSGGLGNTPPFSFYYITPRTAGLSIVRTF